MESSIDFMTSSTVDVVPFVESVMALPEIFANSTDEISGSEERAQIFATMTFVSLSCNIFTLLLSYIMIYRLVE